MGGMRPVRYGRVTNPFGAPGGYASRDDAHGRAGHHTGTDWGKMLVPRLVEIEGKPVRSCTPGLVVISEWNSTMGNWVGVYYAADDVTITYWHLKDRKVARGDRVAQGQIIGHVGNTGNSTAPHLHVQVNRGNGFNYHGHISPVPWCRGGAWWAAHPLKVARAGLRRRRG